MCFSFVLILLVYVLFICPDSSRYVLFIRPVSSQIILIIQALVTAPRARPVSSHIILIQALVPAPRAHRPLPHRSAPPPLLRPTGPRGR